MTDKPQIQVEEGHSYYRKDTYNSLERFISYHHQLEAILGLVGVRDVMEIGPGNKLVASYLKDRGLRVTVCDFDSSVSPDIVADVRQIPVPDNSFDAVMACQVLEHIPFEDFEKALLEMKRISRGYTVISLPRRSAHFEFIFKFPFIRRIFKRNFFDFTIRKAIQFPGFAVSGQHYWEIDNGLYKLALVREKIAKHFKILDEYSPVLNKFHHFFILEKI